MPTPHRHAFRHAVDLACAVVRERDFRLVAQRCLDLSANGMLVRADLPVLTGEPLIVSFCGPRSSRWIDAQAVATRVVHGRRPGDRGRRLGLAFHDLDRETRHALFQQLRAFPPASVPGTSRERARRTEAWSP